ncbi:2-epi-5-epi-valiolone epimerase [Frankia canadensis]|uniref:2-epi-5-epi-valiolone epimerase n=1 Tax=Frankia canadensis TaxID=1836972 RepID=A0A2I2KIE0_9ACTN|nr:VOC family protein [Frankia canadensis]SNQ45431.1 2-epi-5-epi-valiolone epimerase [Frankia canadensis]SOU52721.1 2-epi-5-epi-valiolone epimerase [Frankia canadensis]
MALDVLALDHTGIVVPDLDEAVALLADMFGARELYRRAYAPPPGSDVMARQFGIHPDSSFRLAKVDLAGRHLELFEYAAPDQRGEAPRVSDIGGSHLALRVPDLDAAVAAIRADGRVEPLGDIQALGPGHPLAGRRWIYLRTRWGLLLELVADLV